MLVFEERGRPEKNLSDKGENNKLNPHMALMPGFAPGPNWWEASALTTMPSLAPPKTEELVSKEEELEGLISKEAKLRGLYPRKQLASN